MSTLHTGRPSNEGAFQAAPDNAPREVSQPLTPEAIQAMQAAAARNEQVLPPFNPPAVRAAAQAAQAGVSPPADGLPLIVLPGESRLRAPRAPATDRPPVTTPAESIDKVADVGPVSERLAAVLTPRAQRDPDEPYRPAASETDSPARGMPTAIADPGKKITGGFGTPGAVGYYPLDGYELRMLCERLCESIKARIADDLRFTRALTYPRAFVRLDLTVECWGAALQHHDIPAVAVPHDKTPLDVARELADEVVFVLREQRREFDPAGHSETPANALREEMGAPLPFKRQIGTSRGTDWVDTESPTGQIP